MSNLSGLFCYFDPANTDLRVTIMYLPQKNLAVAYRGNISSNITVKNYGGYAIVDFTSNKFSVSASGTTNTYGGIAW